MAQDLQILIVEDHSIVREGLRALISNAPGLEVVGEAEDGCAAIKAFRRDKPDIVLMDLSMPKMNGLESIKQIKRIAQEARILVLTVHNTEEYVSEALKAGASGFIQKDCGSSELIHAIKCLSLGQTYLSPGISDVFVKSDLNSKSEPPQLATETLTDRERQILKLVGEGARNRDIAEYLFISQKTVEKHRANVMKKLHLHSVSAITAYCMQRGLIEWESPALR